MACDNIDIEIGKRVRQARVAAGLTQTKLADQLGITFQQVQKNERGTNRIGASRLYQLCHVLDVPVGYFFEGIEEEVPTWSPDDVMARSETIILVRAYYRIRDSKVRKALHAMAKAMAKGVGTR